MDLLVRLRAGRMALADLARQAVAAALIIAGVAAGAGLLVFFAVLDPRRARRVRRRGRERRRRPASPRAARRAAGRPLLRQTVPFAIAAAASVLFFRVAVVEMSLISTERETGLFGASFRVIEVLSALPALAVSAAYPVFAAAAHAGDDARLARAVARTTQVCAAAGGALALGLALGAPAVIAVIAGSDFDDAVPVLRIQGLALAASFVAAPWGFALLSLQRERTMMWLNLAGLALAAALAAVLIAAADAKGGALATVLGEAGLAVAFAVALHRTRPNAIDTAPAMLAKVLGAGAVGAAAALIPVPSAVQAVVGLALFAAVLRALGGLPPRAFALEDDRPDDDAAHRGRRYRGGPRRPDTSARRSPRASGRRRTAARACASTPARARATGAGCRRRRGRRTAAAPPRRAAGAARRRRGRPGRRGPPHTSPGSAQPLEPS